MRLRTFSGPGLLLALVLAVLPVIGGAPRAAAQDDDGLVDASSYESPQFGYTVTWGNDWTVRARDVTSNPGGLDTLTLRGAGTLLIAGQADDVSAAEVVEERIALESGNPEDVVDEYLDAEVPGAELLVGRTRILIEAYTLEEHGAVVVAVLSARENRFDDALAAAQEGVRVNDSPVLTGEPLGGAAPIETEEATEEVTEEATETPIDLVPIETEEATEEATGEPTGEVSESGIEGTTFTSALYGYSFEWDEDIWVVGDEYQSADSDGVLLHADSGNLSIWAWDAYGDDPVACLEGESEYFEFEDPGVTDWAPAEDADGEPLRGAGADYAYGVFDLTYTDPDDPDAEPVALVDYIECRAIPGQDAVVIIVGSSTPEAYNDHLDLVLDVADTLVFGEPGTAPLEPLDATPAVTPEQEIPAVTPQEETPESPSGLDGATYTSPGFGFSLEIPAEWTVVDETIAEGEEQLVLTNGVSEVTLWATTAYTGDLEGCIGYVASEVALPDMRIDVTAEGDPFRGSDANGAYANFVYSGEGGEERAFFVACRAIEEGESVLILTQDVPYDRFTTERQARRELQDAIVMP